ncbi:MAG TPA: ATP-binding protein [Solirubrobacterales bacterium]|nr:ATP-binding protein [Solirubrobacterales bacterium]
MRQVWSRLGLRARLALAIGAIVAAAFLAALVAVRVELRDEQGAVQRDAQAEVERTVLVAGGIALAGALLAGYLVAAAFERRFSRLDEALLRQRRFVSDASHELRTPLTAIRGQLEVLARQEAPGAAEVRRVERLALTETARIERLVDDMLLLARLEEDARLHPEPIALTEFLARFAADGSPAGVQLGELPGGTLRADPEALTQVLRNLAGNARRHAGPDGRVALSASPHGATLTLCVDDDGPGIPAAERERVFDRFHRSEAARDRRSGGAGLGLAIARQIVELHGGRIWAERSPLGGARIAFELGGFEPGRAQVGRA